MNEDRANLLRKKQKTTLDHQYVVSNNIDNNVLNTESILDNRDEHSQYTQDSGRAHFSYQENSRSQNSNVCILFDEILLLRYSWKTLK